MFIMSPNVEALYTDKRYLELISKQQPVELQDDLRHFVLIELDKWVSAKGYTGDAFPIACGIVRNQLHSDKSKFFKQYRKAQTAGRAVADMPTGLQDKQLAIVETILEGKPLYDTFHHRAITLPLASMRHQADYYHSRQTGLFKRTTAVVAVPVVVSMEAKDSDDVADRLDELRAFVKKLFGEMASENACIVEVSEPQIVEVKYAAC